MKNVCVYLSLLSAFVLNISCNAMQEDDNVNKSKMLKAVQGKALDELQAMKASVTYPWLANTIGNSLNVVDGELKVGCPDLENEERILALYSELNKEIKTGIITRATEINAQKQKHSGARCGGVEFLKLTAVDDFIGEQAIFSSNGNINFIGRKFCFSSSFIEVKPEVTVISLCPTASLDSPIEAIIVIPKKTPILIKGTMDFEKLIFDDFIVSHSEVKVVFKGIHPEAKIPAAVPIPKGIAKETAVLPAKTPVKVKVVPAVKKAPAKQAPAKKAPGKK